MPKLVRSLSQCSTIADNFYVLSDSGLTTDQINEIFEELEGWLKWKERPSPDIWEGPYGWYKMFSTFAIESREGKTCPEKIRLNYYPRAGLVDIDQPNTWKKRPIPKKP